MSRSFLLVFSLGLVACTTPDYGTATAQTDIRLDKDGGFGGPATATSIRIIGTTASFTAAGRTGTAAVTKNDVDAIIGAFEDARFLDLHGQYTECVDAPTDMPIADMTATLTAGTNTISYYTGCQGGTFDDIQRADKTISDRSGFTAWVAN